MSVAGKFGIKPELLPKKSEYYTDNRRVGIEIEQEYTQERTYSQAMGLRNSTYWRTKPDGSLRYFGVEFCSNILYPGNVDDALKEVYDSLNRGTFSWRTGIHVHIDVSDLDEEQLRSVCELYSVLEPLIFQWEGNERETSRFCVPWYTCPAAVRTMLGRIGGKSYEVQDAFDRFGKYSALNLTSIPRFGTIEFRHLQTTNDMDKLRKYVNLCLAIVEVGSSGIDPGNELSIQGAENFVRSIFKGKLSFLEDAVLEFDRAWQSIDVINNIKMSALQERPDRKRIKEDIFMNRIMKATKGDV